MVQQLCAAGAAILKLEDGAGPGLAAARENAIRPGLAGQEFFRLGRNSTGGPKQASQSHNKQSLKGVAHKAIL